VSDETRHIQKVADNVETAKEHDNRHHHRNNCRTRGHKGKYLKQKQRRTHGGPCRHGKVRNQDSGPLADERGR